VNSEFHSPEPMDEDIERLLRAEREHPRSSPARIERIWTAVSAELVVLAVTGDATAAEPPSSLSTPTPSPSVGLAAPTSAVPAASGSLASALGHLALVKTQLAWIALAAGVGATAAVGASHRVLPSGEKAAGTGSTIAAPSPAPTTAPTSAQMPAPQDVSMAPVVETAAPGLVAVPPAPQPSPDAPAVARHAHRAAVDLALDQEQSLLRQAEDALHQGNWAMALKLTDDYARRYPKGELAEENAYLGIRACLQGGDHSSAQKRLQDFRHRFPLSPLGAQVGE
jgi:hypothetical protein